MTKKKMKNGKTIITHILLMIFALIQIYPLFWLFEFSLKDNSEFSTIFIACRSAWSPSASRTSTWHLS